MDRAPFFHLFLPLLLTTLLAAGCNSKYESPHELQIAAQKRVSLGKGTGTQLKNAGSCQALERELKEIAAAEIETWFENYGSPDTTGVPDNAGGNDGAANDSGDYTNNQVAGVDEADFVKTDGERLYALGHDSLHRFGIPAAGQIQAAESADIEGYPQAILIDGARVLVLSSVYRNDVQPSATGDEAIAIMLPTLAKATLLDWPDGQSASVIAERYFDGRYLTGREIEGVARIVLHGQLPNEVLENLWDYVDEHDDEEKARNAAFDDLAALPLEALLPQSYLRRSDGSLQAQPYTDNDCSAFGIPEDSNSGGVTSVVTVDLHTAELPAARHIVSNYPTVYVSATRMYLAEQAQDWWWRSWPENDGEALNIHAFDISGANAAYLASARAQGRPINQFALDEHDGVLRVATTLGGWWSNTPSESRVHTFAVEEDALRTLGGITGIAPGERLFAARFMGDIGYLVTFEQIDPLFTLDLSDPVNPSIIGELEIPGFSTYLHPAGEGRLLAVGRGGDETGANWNTVVSLFDVSDLAAPALLARHEFSSDNDGWSWSDALYDHKAFQFHDSEALLAVPFGAHKNSNGVWEWISTLELVKVENDTLSSFGSIDHSPYFDSHGDEWSYGASIRRSFFIGDYIYAISGKAVTVHPLDNPSVITADALIPSQ